MCFVPNILGQLVTAAGNWTQPTSVWFCTVAAALPAPGRYKKDRRCSLTSNYRSMGNRAIFSISLSQHMNACLHFSTLLTFPLHTLRINLFYRVVYSSTDIHSSNDSPITTSLIRQHVQEERTYDFPLKLSANICTCKFDKHLAPPISLPKSRRHAVSFVFVWKGTRNHSPLHRVKKCPSTQMTLLSVREEAD